MRTFRSNLLVALIVGISLLAAGAGQAATRSSGPSKAATLSWLRDKAGVGSIRSAYDRGDNVDSRERYDVLAVNWSMTYGDDCTLSSHETVGSYDSPDMGESPQHEVYSVQIVLKRGAPEQTGGDHGYNGPAGTPQDPFVYTSTFNARDIDLSQLKIYAAVPNQEVSGIQGYALVIQPPVFDDEDMAKRVAKAIRHLAVVCGDKGSQAEPF